MGFTNFSINTYFFPDEKYVQTKYSDHRKFTIAMGVLGSFGCAGLWVWDYVIDPIGAQSTILLRLLMIVFGSVYLVSLRRERYSPWIPMALFFTAVSWELIFVLILGRLDTGMVYGISGFMFFLLMPLLVMQGFSTWINILYIFVVVAVPHLAAFAGLAPGFLHKQYAVLMWSEALMAIAVQIALANSYLIRYRAQVQLEVAALTDNATGISNRGHFMVFLEGMLKTMEGSNSSLFLIIMDIDFFKRVNDEHGHPAGDKVIKCVADICSSNVRDRDLVGRLGGEEFGILLSGINAQGAVAVAERIRREVEGASVLSEFGPIQFTCSLGVAARRANDTMEDIYDRADKALYVAKNTGRNRVFLSD